MISKPRDLVARAKKLRLMAEETRSCAEGMSTETARRGMLECAGGYEVMAEQAEQMAHQLQEGQQVS
jgi:hypothetical protein